MADARNGIFLSCHRTMKNLRNLVLFLCLALLVSLQAQITKANTKIYNQATAIYKFQGQEYTTESNLVITQVLPVYGVTVSPDGTTDTPGQIARGVSGSNILLPYRLQNNGNDVDDFHLLVSVENGSTFIPGNLKIAWDQNGNGQWDTNEAILQKISNVPAEEYRDLLVLLTIPVNAEIGNYAFINIQALSSHDINVKDTNNVARVEVVSGPVLDVRISRDVSVIVPDSEVTYTVKGSNIGKDLARPVPVTLDNAQASGILVQAPIPEWDTQGTVFVPDSASSAFGKIVYSIDSGLTWFSNPPTGQTINSIGLLLENPVAPDQAFGFEFKVNVDEDYEPGYFDNQAKVAFQDISGTQYTTESNVVKVKVEIAPAYDTLIGPLGKHDDDVDGDNNEDFQVIEKIIAGNKGVYTFTAWNGSKVPQTLNFYVKSLPEGWGHRFLFIDGYSPLIDNDNNNWVDVGLVPKKRVHDLALEITVPASWTHKGPYNIEVYVALSGDTGTRAHNRTNLRVQAVVPVADIWSVRKSSVLPIEVEAGDANTYTLAFEHLQDGIEVTNVRIHDVISTYLTTPQFAPVVNITDENGSGKVVTATAAYDSINRILTWTIPSINGRFRGRVSFSTRVRDDAAEDSVFTNQFSLVSSHNTEAVVSNIIEHHLVKMDLNVEKNVNKNEATVGDILVYNLKVTGAFTSSGDISDLHFYDNLPLGFTYIKGTSVIDGKKAPDPSFSSNGRIMSFPLGIIKNGQTIQIQYMARIGPGTKLGKNANVAWAGGKMPLGTPKYSLQTSANVEVKEGVFADRAFVFGRVYIDRNNNESYDCEEDIALPGTKVFMENGQYAITDRDGQYTIEDLRLGNHVIGIDSSSLPPYIKVKDVGRHTARNGKTQFIDFKLPGAWRSDFLLEFEKNKYVPCKALFQATMSQNENTALFDSKPLEKQFHRVLLLPWETDQVSKVDKMVFQYAFDEITKQGKLGLAVTLYTPLAKDIPQGESLQAKEIQAKLLAKIYAIGDTLKQRFALGEDRLSLKWEDGTLITRTTMAQPKITEKTTGIISPLDGAVFMDENSIKVKITSLLQNKIFLYSNGKEIPVSQIGSRSFHVKTAETTVEYVGVPIQLGKNTVELVLKPAQGQEIREAITVYKSKPPKKIVAKTLPHQIPADGTTEPVVVIELQDEEGKPATSGLFLNIKLENGNVITPDSQPSQAGHQLYVKEGKAECLLGASNEVKDCKLTVEIAGLKQEFKVSYTPYLRDWIIVGLGEVTAGYENWQGQDKDEGLYVNGRAAFFAKGQILGKLLLTAHYDSSLPRDDENILFKKVDPDKYYPVYGDSSQKGTEVQTTGRLYVKLEQDRNYIMYGDYQTEINGLLTAYNRTFRGFKGEIQTKYLEVKAFGTRSEQTMVKDEIRGQGISGYYFLSQKNIIENTTQVVIETRDRFQTQRVLKRINKTLNADYQVNYTRGWILFDTPIVSQDENGNPVYIVVTYETKDAASKEYMGGVQASIKLLDEKVKLGGTYIYEGQNKGHTTIQGVHAEVEPIEKVKVRGEIANTSTYDIEDKATKKGDGYALEATAELDSIKGRAGYQKISKDFRNPSISGTEEGSEKYYAEADIKINENIKGQIKANRSETETRMIQGAGVRSSIKSGDFTLLFGYEFIQEKRNDPLLDTKSTNAHILTSGVKWDIDEQWSVKVERQQVLPGSRVINSQAAPTGTFTKTSSNMKEDFLNNRNGFHIDSIGDKIVSRTLLGAEYQPVDWLKVWVNQEFEDDFEFAASRTLFGMNLQLTQHVDLYSSYGMESGIEQDRNQALIGIKTNIPLTQWLSGNVFVEQVQTYRGDNPEDFTAYGFSLKMNRIHEQGSLRIEFRHTDTGTQFLGNPALTWKTTDDITFFWRTRHFQNGRINNFQHSTLLGLSYRPDCSDTTNLFFKGQFDWDRDLYRELPWEEFSIASSWDLHLRPFTSWDFMLRYANKYSWSRLGKSKGDSFMDLIAARTIYEFHERFDIGLHTGIFHDYEARKFEYAYGIEAGMKVVKNLWLSIGYNIKGFKDNKMTGNDFLKDGVYITLRFKFDETTAEELLPAW